MKIGRIFIFMVFFFFVACSDETSSVHNDSDAVSNDNVVQDDDTEINADSDVEEKEDFSVDSDLVDYDEDFSSDEDASAEIIFTDPDPAYESNPVAVIITKDEFANAFAEMAAFHTVTGIYTKVVTIESICSQSVCDDTGTKNDTAKAIKNYLMSIPGLKYAVLGGDIEVVPSRKIHDKYTNVMAGTFEEDFYTDFYYADFSEWDSDGDGVYAGDDDTPDYSAEIAVGRIPASDTEEIARYFDKMVANMTHYDTAYVKTALLLANVATNFNGVDVNAGYYFENEGRTVDIIPTDFSIKKLYTSTFPSPASDAEALNNDSEKAGIEGGVNIIVHNGHGYPSLLSCEQSNDDNDFTGDMAYALQNSVYPIFLSCACQAGEFESPFTYTYENSSGQTSSVVFNEDSAGELLINAPLGGAVAYIGNTTTGLGIAGGSQFIDEMLRSMFTTPSSVLGDTYIYAHANMKSSDTFTPPLVSISVPVVDEDSWRWTKKAVVLLGSPLLTVWRDSFQSFTSNIEITASEVEGGYALLLNIPEEFDGANIEIYTDGSVYSLSSAVSGEQTRYIKSLSETLFIGAEKEGYQFFFKEFNL